MRSAPEGDEGKALSSSSNLTLRNNQDEAIRRSDIEAFIKLLKDNSGLEQVKEQRREIQEVRCRFEGFDAEQPSRTTRSIDDLAAKVDQRLKGNQSQVFIMEEATPEKSASDLAFEAELSGDDQQEVSYVNGQGWQLKNYHPNPIVRNNQQLFWPKQDKPTDQYAGYQKNYQPRAYVLSQPQNNTLQMQKHQNPQPATSTPIVATQDETKVMLQQLLQGQQLQGKALNQVTTEINTRMNHMFGDLSTKYDNVASHIRQMDIQIAHTAESVKRQQGTLPGKTDKNPKECNAVQLRSGKQLSEPEKRRFTTAEKGKQKESEQLAADTAAVERNAEPAVGTSSPGPEQPAEAVRPIPEVVPPREYIPKVPYPVPAKATRKDREEMKCRKMLEDLTVRLPLMDAIQMMPSMRSFMKGLISGKISEESEFMTVSKECSAPEKRRFTTAEKGKQKESEQLPADTPTVERNTEPAVGTSSPGPEQPAEAVCPIPEVVPPREYIPKVPYPIPAKATQDPLELALVRAEAEQSVVNIDADGYAKMLDSTRSLEQVKEQRREIQEVRCRFEGFDAEQPSRTTRRLFPKRTSV
ncbi:hypothetical protein F2Q68_00025538 [Brassica cretica]|uniref:Uncharacterized protein n=1 Tax=Brassica cretica TaxID=69181 RepID=A0A8S9IGH4_BRACR|nr:hypothetical protein F2Q68_00025538 [Brassica cretica]